MTLRSPRSLPGRGPTTTSVRSSSSARSRAPTPRPTNGPTSTSSRSSTIRRATSLLPTEAPGVLRRGFLVLYDELGLGPRLEEAAAAAPGEPPPTAAELEQVCADLWYHGLWTAKKLRRGELWTALECLDSHMRHRLLALLRWRAVLDGRPVWHGARFVERWAGEPRGLLAATFGSYDERELGRALWGMLDLAGRLEDDHRARLGVPVCDRSEAARLIADVQPR